MKRAARTVSLATAVLFGVLSAACTGLAGQGADSYSTEKARAMFSVGLRDIRNIYIEEPSISEMALAGLAGLRQIEPKLSVLRGEETIRVVIGGQRIDSVPTPAEGDAQAWAWTVARLIESARSMSASLGSASSEKIYAAVFNGFARKLDRFSRYAGIEAATENRASRQGFGGIGISVEMEEQGARTTTVQPGTPAAKAGLRIGDRIVAINDEQIAGYDRHHALRLLRGPVDSEVLLSVLRARSPQPMALTMKRKHIVPDTVSWRREGDIAYISLSGFNRETTDRVAQAVAEARDEIGDALSGIVLDLRGNPGGLLDQAVDVADLFLEHGRIVSTRGRHPKSLQFFDAHAGDVSNGAPMVVLVNGASASAAEILAAALQDHGRAAVVGTNSYGKGTVQTVLRLPNNGELILTWARIHAPSGYVLHRIGVLPTICTSAAEDWQQVLERFRNSGIERTPGDFALRRHADFKSKADQDAVRAICPWRPREGRDLEVETAKALLQAPELYRRAVKLTQSALAG